MPGSLQINLKTDLLQAELSNRLQDTDDQAEQNKQKLAQLFKDISNGNERANCDITVGAAPVKASGTWTFSTVIATDTVTVGGVTFTAVSGAPTATQFDIDDGDTAAASNLAAQINDHSTISQIVTATAAAAVVTVTCKFPGVIGNFIEFTDADATITSSGSGYLAGGTGLTEDAAVSEVHTILCVADDTDDLDGTYFILPKPDGTNHAFWIDTDDSGTTIPAGASAADAATEITTIATDDTAATVAAAVEVVIKGQGFRTSVSTATITATADEPGKCAKFRDSGDSGFTLTRTVEGKDKINYNFGLV